MAKKPIEALTKEELEALYKAGTARTIAEEYGVPVVKVEWRIKKLGIKKTKEERDALRREVLKQVNNRPKIKPDKEPYKRRKDDELGYLIKPKKIVLKSNEADPRNVMTRPVYDPKKKPVTWRY